MVIAILAILAAMLMPALERARWTAKRAVCLHNLKQWGIGSQMFGQDHGGRVPRGIDWHANWCGGGNCGPSTTSENPSKKISKYFFPTQSGASGGTAPCHARNRYFAVSTGGITAWRLTANGLLARDYLGAPDAVYCPDTNRPMGQYTSRKWLDWNNNYYWNGVMIDASAKWLGTEEMKRWVDTYNDIRNSAIPYYPSGPYGYSRFENDGPGYDSPGVYGGQKVKMQILVR